MMYKQALFEFMKKISGSKNQQSFCQRKFMLFYTIIKKAQSQVQPKQLIFFLQARARNGKKMSSNLLMKRFTQILRNYQMEQDIIIKLCIVGEPGVGKTSMLYQYVFKKFDQNTRPTIGCDFSTKLKSTIDGKTIRLQLWDIAGQERFNAVSKMYIRGALGCIIVCSAEVEKTLEETLKWKKIIDQNCDHDSQNRTIPTLLVQNKTDMIDNANIKDWQKRTHLDDFAKTHDFSGVCCTSAKENKNIEECFQQLLDEIIKRGLIKDLKPIGNPPANSDQKKTSPVKLTNAPPKTDGKSKKCC